MLFHLVIFIKAAKAWFRRDPELEIIWGGPADLPRYDEQQRLLRSDGSWISSIPPS